MNIHQPKSSGFTLVELSIVIIIIGFLIAGIAAGQSLIKQAQINSVVTDLTTFQTAINMFQFKYGALPGDITNAYAYFGNACGTNTSGAVDSCNGDGDGLLTAGPGGGSALPLEDLKFWQHLSLAGLLQGNYTGAVSGVRQEAGINVAASKIPGGGYRPGSQGGAFYGRDISQVSTLQLGKLYLPFGYGVYGAGIITPGESFNIDNKMDDGDPVNGKIMVMRGNDVFDQNVCMTDFVFSGQPESLILDDQTGSCALLYLINRNGDF